MQIDLYMQLFKSDVSDKRTECVIACVVSVCVSELPDEVHRFPDTILVG